MSTNTRLVLAGTCLLTALSLLAGSTSAWAEPAEEVSRAEAKRLLRAGTAAYQRHDYRAALADFQSAMAAFPSPRIQYNLGQTLLRLHQPVEATVAFETFLKDSDRITSQQRSEAAQALKQLEPEVGRVTLQTNVPEVEVEIDGTARGKTPLNGPLVLAPGRHEVALARAGFSPLHDMIEVAGGEERKANFVLSPNRPAPPVVASAPQPDADPKRALPAVPALPLPAAAPVSPEPARSDLVTPAAGPPHAPESRAHARHVLGSALLGTSAALAAGGAAFLGASWSSYNKAKDGGCNHNCPGAADDVDSRALWSKILFGAAAATGIGAAAVFVSYPDAPASRETAGLPGGLVVGGQGRF